MVNNFFDKIDDEWKIALKKSYLGIDLEQEIISAKMWLLSNTHKSKSNFKAFLNNWLATAMRNGKSVQQEDSRSNYKKYVPPVINEEDMASPEEISMKKTYFCDGECECVWELRYLTKNSKGHYLCKECMFHFLAEEQDG